MSFIFNYIKRLFYYGHDDNDLEKDEAYLADAILNVEFTKEENEVFDVPEDPAITEEACFEKTGCVTFVAEDYILIDGNLFYEFNPFGNKFSVGDSIDFVAYQDKHENVKVIKVLHNRGVAWEDEYIDKKQLNITEHVVVGEVSSRDDRTVFIKDTDLRYHLDEVETTLIPMPGDWLELCCMVQWDIDNFKEITADNVIKVISVRPLRSIIKTVKVTYYTPLYGICDSNIYFDERSLPYSFSLELGSKVIVEAIESNQERCSWRALRLIPENDNNINQVEVVKKKEKDRNEETLVLENDKNLDVTHPIAFKDVELQQIKTVTLNILNKSSNIYTFRKWIICGKKYDSQIQVQPEITRPVKLYPNKNIEFIITCKPRFVGGSGELLVLLFKGFEIKRWINIHATDPRILTPSVKQTKERNEDLTAYKYTAMKNVLTNQRRIFIPGVKMSKRFVAVKIGQFPVPDKVWNAVLGVNNEQKYNKYEAISRIESCFPCLLAPLNINNYTDRWHALLYLEEVENAVAMRAYDMPKVFLNRYQEYVTVEIDGLSERKPSLIVGNRVIVKDIWDTSKPDFEGFIYLIKGNSVWMKFGAQFHDSYGGQEMSIEFHQNRSVYRKCHHAINAVISALGPDILFPKRISIKSQQVSDEKLKAMSWHNNILNDCQKSAIHNILLGVCRPMPYCIFGPPGTGKTITLVEAVLQILTLIPNSRVLVSTPSNSAANLFTERLVDSKSSFTGSVLRILSHNYFLSQSVPDSIRPYCATVDIARDGTAKCNQSIVNDINVECRSSFVGRHRVTIGTGLCIGSLFYMGFPKGHFTHIVVDEAGQATEPEIMIPLSFVDREKCQIILAGDPMQLGPVVISKLCLEFGMDEAYFSRILQSFPYQQDSESLKGYDERFVTQLVDNYRTLENALKLPSSMFYNSTLIPRKIRTERVDDLLREVADIFPNNKLDGGIYMYGIQGSNYRAEESPSWYNPQEALMVFMTTCKLYKRDVVPDEIGIICPYIAQTIYLRKLFDSSGAVPPKIGTVEEFQGQERPIILISTVRSLVSSEDVDRDLKFSLGFIRSPNRLNVALTRGEVATIIFCNPHLLSLDPLWNKVISHVVGYDCYTGCDLPA